MSQTVTCSCGKRYALRDDQRGRSMRCPACGARLTAPGRPDSEAVAAPPTSPPSGASGAEALAALFNNMNPKGAKNLAAALNAAGKPTAPTPSRPHRFGTLGCALPLGLLLCASFAALFVMPGGEPPPLAAYFFVGGLAAALILFSLWRMRGHWTRGRIIWSSCLAGVFALAILIASTKAHAEQGLTVKFAPVVQALGDVKGLQEGPSGAGLRPKVLPVVLTKKGTKKDAPPTPPEVAFELYGVLPDSLKAAGPDDVQTVVLLDYGWNRVGTYQNQVTGNTGGAYIGKCNVTVVDRKSRLVVARETVFSTQEPPSNKMTAMEWWGNQPDDEQIVKYLQGLPTRQGDIPAPAPPPDDRKGAEDEPPKDR